MKARRGARVLIPFITTNDDKSTDRNWAKLDFSGPVDRRRVKREIRKWVKRSLERNLDTFTLLKLMKQVDYY